MDMSNTATINTNHGIQVGDLFASIWGYDQTNVDFYKAIRVTKTKVELVQIGAKHVAAHTGGDTLAPDPDVELDAASMFDGRRSKLCTVRIYRPTSMPWQDDKPVEVTVLLKSGSSWSCTYTASPIAVDGTRYDNSRIGR